MPIYEDGKYQAFYIGDMHPVKIMDGNDVIVRAKLLEQTGTALAFADTYNDTVQGLTVFGKSDQVQTLANNNLCSSFNYNKWVLVNGAYLQDGWIYLPNSNSYAYIDIPWWQKASYFYCRLTVQSDYYNTGTRAHIQTEYRLNGTALSANGYAVIIDAVTDQRKGTQFGSPSNPDAYGQAIAQADTIRFIVKRSTDYARQPYRFKDVYVSTVYTNLTDPHLVFVPNFPSPDYPAPITSVTGNLNITDGTDIKQTLALTDFNGIAGVYDTYEPRVLVDVVWRSRKTQRVGKITLAASDVSQPANNSGYTNITYARFIKPAGYTGSANLLKSYMFTHATTQSDVNTWDNALKIGKVFGGADYNYFWVGFPHGTSLADMQSALTGAILFYQLATPIVTLGDPVDILTYPGQTHLDAGGAELMATCRVVDAI